MVDERPARGQALAILRGLRAWSQQELAEAAGLTRATIGGYEQGTHALTPRKLWELAKVMGHSKEKVRDVLRLFGSPAVASERWVGPVRFTAAEERALREFGDQESRQAGLTLRKLLRQARVQEATHQDRKAARELWVNLRAERRLRKAIQEQPEYQTWAISELLCEESIQAARAGPTGRWSWPRRPCWRLSWLPARRGGDCGFWDTRRPTSVTPSRWSTSSRKRRTPLPASMRLGRLGWAEIRIDF